MRTIERIREEPEPGDRVQVAGRIRRVTKVDGHNVCYTTETQANAHKKCILITTWQAWSKKGVLP